MDGPLLKAEAMVAGRKMYEVSAATGICPRTLTEIFAGRRNVDQRTTDRIRTAIWGNAYKILVLQDSLGSGSGSSDAASNLASNESVQLSEDKPTDA